LALLKLCGDRERPRPAALIVTLAPGNYSAVVTSADGNVGTTLVEVYQLSQ
jgi:hypothetical protein